MPQSTLWRNINHLNVFKTISEQITKSFPIHQQDDSVLNIVW